MSGGGWGRGVVLQQWVSVTRWQWKGERESSRKIMEESSFLGRVNIMTKGTEESKCTACLRKGKCYRVVKGRQAVRAGSRS